MLGLGINIGVGTTNNSGLGPISIPGLVASYRSYNNTNESPDRNTLKDLSGNGHNITLYNFSYNEESGYGVESNKSGLVLDGTDDYGVCNNMPIFTKDRGYTILVIRKYLDGGTYPQVCLRKHKGVTSGAFTFELLRTNTQTEIVSFDTSTQNVNHNYDLFSYQTSKMFNGQNIISGNIVDGPDLELGRHSLSSSYYAKMVFYAAEIYDRDLSEEEIQSIKIRMMLEYQDKTK